MSPRRSLALLVSAGCAAALIGVSAAAAAPAPSRQPTKDVFVQNCYQPWGVTSDTARKIETCYAVEGGSGQWQADLFLEVGARATTASNCSAKVRLELSRSSNFSDSWYTGWATDNG